MFAVEINNVSKTYLKASRPAVQDVQLQISPGERIGLIGANGSGKTTLLRLLMNFVLPDRGSIQILGESNLEKARRFIGFVPERQEGMENFTPRELLQISAKMHGMSGSFARKRIEELLTFAELRGVADELLSDFSKGMAQRVQICIALIHQPQILLLDEPMSGLDPSGQKDIKDLLLRLTDLTLIYASHNLEEIETFCSSVLIIHEGKIVKQLNLEEIGQEIFTIEMDRPTTAVMERFADLKPRVLSENAIQIEVQIITDSDSIQKFIAALNDQQVNIRRLRSRSILEEYYHQYVMSAKNA
jgi:ABC-2 type transport system ATP-binding protein